LEQARNALSRLADAAHPWGCDPAGLGEELLGQPVLLDTHVLQWWWWCPGLLSPLVRSLLKQPPLVIWRRAGAVTKSREEELQLARKNSS